MKLVGLLALDKDQIAEARKRPVLGLLFVDDGAMEWPRATAIFESLKSRG